MMPTMKRDWIDPSLARRLLLGLACVLPGSFGGCDCDGDAQSPDAGMIDRAPIVQANPGIPRPDVFYPAALRQEDASFNAFIDKALTICHQGDYDNFRQLFGIAHEPTGEPDFERVWKSVKDMKVTRVVKGPQSPPQYYLLIQVNLREPDPKQRTSREVPIAVFQEAGEWRLGPAPKAVIEQLRAREQVESRNEGAGGASQPAPPAIQEPAVRE